MPPKGYGSGRWFRSLRTLRSVSQQVYTGTVMARVCQRKIGMEIAIKTALMLVSELPQPRFDD